MNDALRTVLDRLNHVRKTGKGWQARCPAHDDHKPSLSISEGDDHPVVLNCHSHCTFDEVMYALGLKEGDAMAEESELRGSVTRKAKRAPKPTAPELSDAEVNERRRAYLCMETGELRMYDEYLARRTRAVQKRDRTAMERWNRKLRDLCDQVLRRELRMHNVVDEIDSNYRQNE